MASEQDARSKIGNRFYRDLRSFWAACKLPLVRVSLVISLICALVMLFSFHYSDADAFLSWSACFWDCIFRVTDLDFYAYTATYPRGAEAFLPSNLSILMMLPLAIWNFPIWLIHMITGEMDVNGALDVIWFKLLLLILMVACAKVSYEIAQMITKSEKNALVIPLVFGSATLLISTMYASQDEILYMVAFLFCLKSLFEDKRVSFFVYSVITVALSNEMLLPIFLLLVIREHRLLKALGCAALAALPAVLIELIYRSNSVYQAAKQELGISDAIHMLFTRGTSFTQYVGDASYMVPVFICLVVVLFFFAYTVNANDEAAGDRGYRFKTLWLVTLLMTSMSVLVSGTMLEWFYRACLYVPFLAILVCTSRQSIKANLTLLVVFEYVKAFICLATNAGQNMSSRFLAGPISDALGESVEPFSFYEKLSTVPVISNLGIFFAILIGILIILFVINSWNNDSKQIDGFSARESTLLIAYSLCMPLYLLAFVALLFKTLIL